MDPCKFRIAFIAHNEIELLRLTIKNNLKNLCDNTIMQYDTVLLIDGCNKIDKLPFIQLAEELNIDEVRFRSKINHSASGHESNNAHYHIMDSPYKYLITIEADVAIFRTNKNTDLLKKIDDFFVANSEIPICYKIDDYECWQEKLVFLGSDNKKNKFVNRVSTHFLIYNTNQFKKIIGDYSSQIYYDNEKEWYNHEDLISRTLLNNNKRIVFLEDWPFKIYHCDVKIAPNSPHYLRDDNIRVKEFYKHLKNSIL